MPDDSKNDLWFPSVRSTTEWLETTNILPSPVVNEAKEM